MQSISSTASVTSTDGFVRDNLPINFINAVRATSGTQRIGSSGDNNDYPVIRFDINTKAIQYWFYDIGDEATRDADLVALDSISFEGGGNIFDSFGLTGGYFQSQGFGAVVGSSTHLINNQYAISISLNGSYAEFSMLKMAGAVSGDTNFAIYDSGADGFPNQKIWQSAEFAVTGVVELLQNTLSPAVSFSAGTYWFSWHGDAAFTWQGMSELGKMGFNLSGTTLGTIRRIFSVVPYAATLPETWVAAINFSLSGTPPMLLQKKEI